MRGRHFDAVCGVLTTALLVAAWAVFLFAGCKPVDKAPPPDPTPACLPCVPGERDACPPGGVCVPPGPESPDVVGEGVCAQACSLTVWHTGDTWTAPCEAGVDGCPDTCWSARGLSTGHCTGWRSAPLDTGACVMPSGALACHPPAP